MKKHRQRNQEKAFDERLKRTAAEHGFSASVNEVNPNDLQFRALWLGEGNEPLTETKIKELIENGWKEKDLRFFASQGYLYNRIRNSMMGPLESSGF